MSKQLPYDHPDYEFPKEVHNLLVSSLAAHVQLSAMADSKASILMGSAFVVFTLSLNQLISAPLSVSLPMMVLALSSFAATVLSVLAVMPKIVTRAKGPNANVLFFGVFSHAPEGEFVDHIVDLMRSEERTYRAMARDLHQNGVVLQRKKYYYLTRAYQVFLFGVVATATVFVAQVAWGPLLSSLSHQTLIPVPKSGSR